MLYRVLSSTGDAIRKRVKNARRVPLALSRTVLVLGLITAVSPTPSWSQRVAENVFEFGNNEDRVITGPSFPGRAITVVSVLDYVPAGDDDFAYRIIPETDIRFRVQTARGNGRSILRLRLMTIQLPEGVSRERYRISASGRNGTSTVMPSSDHSAALPS